jgi:Ca-activated chloride channel family protein
MLKSLPTLSDDELRPEPAAPANAAPEAGFGALATERGCLPLRGLDVRARLDGLIARVEVRQVFVNTHAEPLEATYIFPLPDRAAVTRFRLEVAGRVVEGDLRERGAARQEYDQALRAGHRAAIAEEERPGVFTMRVGNLPPGERASVLLTLVGPLPFAAGEATFRFPLVVAPRYVPGVALPGPSVGDGVAADTDAVPDASRISPPVLLPGFPNPVRLGLCVEVAPSPLGPHSFRSSLHTVVEETTGSAARFRLQPGERLDRDFVLRFRLGADRVHTGLTLQPDAQGEEGTFLLTVVPPSRPAGASRPRDVVFVLDRSGSMSGWKMVAARRAVARMVETLTERDRFTVYAFDDQVEVPPGFDGLRLVSASDHQRFRATEFLAGIDARGGTEMAQPLEQAVAELTRPTHGGAERVLVLITDGQVGNEDQVLRRLGRRAREVRIFTLGVDRAVNAAFLRRLADLGGGASEVVESEERLDEVMDHVHRHLGTPVLTGLRLELAGLRFLPETLVPGRLPDLFEGAPLLIAGRYRGPHEGALAVRAVDATGRPWSAEVSGWREDGAPLASVWARGRVRELEDRYVVGAGDLQALEREIVNTSLRFGVLCRFTAYVAVDRATVVNPGGEVHGVVQPVEQPQGWGAMSAAPCAAAVPRAPGFMAAGAVPEALLDAFALEESLDSMEEAVLRAERPPSRRATRSAKASPPAPGGKMPKDAEAGGLLAPLLRLFRRRGKGKAPAFDHAPFRPRVEDLLRRLQAGAAAPLDLLRALLDELEALFKDLVAAGDRDPAVGRLGQAVVDARALLGQARPDEARAAALCQVAVDALTDWLNLPPPPTSAEGRREGFWK